MHVEYKFRAWDKIKKKYIYDVEKGLKVCLPSGDTHVMTIAEINDNQRYILEQYSGLKDKYGRAIYENDIVQITGESTGRMWVSFENGNFLVTDWPGWNASVLDLITIITYYPVKVVDNVHKNSKWNECYKRIQKLWQLQKEISSGKKG